MEEKIARQVAQFQSLFEKITAEVHRVIVGQDEVVEGIIMGILSGGHCLLEGVPGLGKTLMVKTLAQTVKLKFSRIQFTPDLMPADIIGTNMIVEDQGQKRFEFRKGPVFANIVLADEINRATPKTQSALLEAMQEKSVTVSNETFRLDPPFFVLATQNPLEMEGTYPLPEAQIDRFLFKLYVPFPDKAALQTIMERTTINNTDEASPVLSRDELVGMIRIVRDVEIAPHVLDYGVRILQATHPNQPDAPLITRKYVRYGASPRGAQAMILGGKVKALIDNRFHVSCADLTFVAKMALRHRIILNFEGEAEGISSDRILDQILLEVPEIAAK